MNIWEETIYNLEVCTVSGILWENVHLQIRRDYSVFKTQEVPSLWPNIAVYPKEI